MAQLWKEQMCRLDGIGNPMQILREGKERQRKGGRALVNPRYRQCLHPSEWVGGNWHLLAKITYTDISFLWGRGWNAIWLSLLTIFFFLPPNFTALSLCPPAIDQWSSECGLRLAASAAPGELIRSAVWVLPPAYGIRNSGTGTQRSILRQILWWCQCS